MYPCPQPWFADFAQLKTVAEELKISVIEAYYVPLHWRLKALAYAEVMEKAKPGLEAIAEQRAKQKARDKKLGGI